MFQTELMSVLEAGKLINKLWTNKKFYIGTESKAVFRGLDKNMFSSSLLYERHKVVTSASLNNVITMAWIKGHNGDEANTIADRLARDGAETPFWELEPLYGDQNHLLYFPLLC